MNQPGLPIFHVPPIDMRGGDEIENELDEEFAFHLDQSARDLKNEGRSSTEAEREARARFGDIETIKRDCKRIAMKERIMLQRINLALMIVVLVVVGLVSVQMFTTQQYNTLALQAITSDLAQIKLDGAVARNTGAGAGAGAGAGTATPPANIASILVEGDVEEPGWYPITLDGATYLHEILKRAGVKEQMWFQMNRDPRGTNSLQLSDGFLGEESPLVVMKPDDGITVYATLPDRYLRKPRDERARDRVSGTWREVRQDGTGIRGGWELSVIDAEYLTGVLHKPDTAESIDLHLSQSYAVMTEPQTSRFVAMAFWQYDSRNSTTLLMIDFTPSGNVGRPAGSSSDSILFERVEAETDADGNAVEADDGA